MKTCESHACVGTKLTVDEKTGQKVVQTYDTKVEPPELVDQVPVEMHAQRVAKVAENAGATIMDIGLGSNPERFDEGEQRAYLRDLRSGHLDPDKLEFGIFYVSEERGLNPYNPTTALEQAVSLRADQQPVTIGA